MSASASASASPPPTTPTPTPSRMPAALAKDRLGAPAVGFFILAGVAPLTVTEGVVPSAFASTGLTSVPAAFLVVAAVLAVFVIGYLAMSRRIPNAGAAYAFISQGLGRPAGMAGWLVAVVAYNLLQVGLYGMIGPQLASFAADNFNLHAAWWVWGFGAWAVVAVLGLLRVDLSGRVLGVLSVLELVVIVAVTVRGLAHPASAGVSFTALSPAGLHASSLGAVLAVAVLGFVGIEQGPVFSEEARTPRRTIPLATYISLGVIAVVYAAASWALVVHYGDQVVPTAQGPDGTRMLFAMAPGLVAGIGRCLFLTSLLAAALAFHAAVGRYMWAVGRERVLPTVIGTTGSTGAPQAASLVQSLLGAVAILLTMGFHWDPVGQLFFWGGTTGGVGILLVLTAASAAIVRFFWTRPGDETVWRRLVAPTAATVLLAVVAWLCIDHFDVLLNVAPGSLPTKILPGLFGAAAVIGAAWALVLKHRQPAAYAAIGLGSIALSPHDATAIGTEATPSAAKTGDAS